MEHFNLSVVDWSRAQFALTAIYHWLFVPLTLGLSFIIAFMETMYYRTGDQQWKDITKFWMTLFGINFALGVATGIILEFEFGTNWSNYSWFVGDIFGAPLAVEGIMAFFMETTFIAIMFFGWNKVNKKIHLLATWLVAIGASLSAWWILVANAWMEYPVGMSFNPMTVRNEMINFWNIALSSMAINKFLHTIASGYVLASVFVAGISAWYMLHKREKKLVNRSLIVASVFGLLSSLFLALTGDGSARLIARIQPVKFASMEGYYNGQSSASLIAVGILGKKNKQGEHPFIMKIEIPHLLSIMAFQNPNAFIAGINDLINGNDHLLSVKEKMQRGQKARETLHEFKMAKQANNIARMDSLTAKINDISFKEQYFKYFGYAFLNNPKSIIPNVPISFYSFHIMVILGFYFIFLFVLLLLLRVKLEKNKWLLWLALLSIPLPYIASECGWVLCELGRQPWIIQDLMPVAIAASGIDASSVQITFMIFAVIFTVLLIAEIRIMIKQIKIGPQEDKH